MQGIVNLPAVRPIRYRAVSPGKTIAKSDAPVVKKQAANLPSAPRQVRSRLETIAAPHDFVAECYARMQNEPVATGKCLDIRL